MVGAVLVHNYTIIGEGYHCFYGGPHAEVECISSVKHEHKHLISESVLYVSLEPCSHFGKTPPCADLIILHQIKKVVIGCADPFAKKAGKGIEKLRAAGVEVIMSELEEDAIEVNKRFFTFHTKGRPYIILKWAQSGDGKIAADDREPLKISNAFTDRLVHRWRSEEQAILVGTSTALADDPQLTTRLWPGNNPVRIVLDRFLRLPASLRLFDKTDPTIVLNKYKNEDEKNLRYFKLSEDGSAVSSILQALHSLSIQSVLVEGGASLLQSFINENLWDEARVITNQGITIGDGLAAPQLQNAELFSLEQWQTDTIKWHKNSSSLFQPIN